jgi:hypothetical protein
MAAAGGNGSPRQWFASAMWLIAGGLAAGSRGDAGLFVIAVSGLGLVLLVRHRSQWRPALAGLATIAVAGAFFLGSGQSRLASQSFPEGVQPHTPEASSWAVLLEYLGLFSGVTGAPWGMENSSNRGLGWLDTPVPSTTWVAVLGTVAALSLVGLAYLDWRKVVAVLALTGMGIAMAARSLTQVNAYPGELFQPRYLLPLVMAVFGLLLVVGPGRRLALTRVQLGLMWALLSYGGVMVLHSWIKRWTVGSDLVGRDLDGPALWWPTGLPAPSVVWLLGSVAWSVLLAIALLHLQPPSTGGTWQPVIELPAQPAADLRKAGESPEESVPAADARADSGEGNAVTRGA